MAKVVAKESFFHFTKSGMTPVKEGQAFNETDPAVKANPAKFITADEWVEGASKVFDAYRAVEAATAAPGETRTVKKPAKAKKKT